MNIFNRVIMVIGMLCLIIFSIVGMVNVFTHLFEWSLVSDRINNYISNLNPYVLAAILFLILVIALIILIFEFYRKKITQANISSDQTGKTMVTLKTLSEQIRESIANIQDVVDPQIRIVPKQNGIIINIFSKLTTGINVTDKTKEIRETASDFASKNLGLKVLQTNYTATGFVAKKVKVEVIKEEAPVEDKPVEVKQEEQNK
ncbi:MAG: alkaline shock response membrane anchor protein AmaP [Actinobacteria bacterium]|nr:alkaline shock response membrane anchor protein AmaP [Actinomycetota bacterium]